MGTIRKVGDIYYIEFYARGLLYAQAAGPDPVSAQKLLEQTEAKIAGGEAMTVAREIDLAVFFEQFLSIIRQGFSPRTVERFSRAIAHFKTFLKTQYPNVSRLSQVTPSVIESYKVFLMSSAKPVLVNFSILLLREALEHGIKSGFINDNPTLHVRLLPWPVRQRPATRRYRLARELFSKGASFGKTFELLRLPDIGRMVYYANLIPLSREDMYN